MTCGASRQFPFLPGHTYIQDRGYFDLKRFRRWNDEGVFFICRLKKNVNVNIDDWRPFGDDADQISRGTLFGDGAVPDGPRKGAAPSSRGDRPRRREASDPDRHQSMGPVGAGNCRTVHSPLGQIVLFHRWIKQHLKLATPWGESRSAIALQILAALCAYVLLKLMALRTRWRRSLLALQRLVILHLTEADGVFFNGDWVSLATEGS